MAIKAQLKPRKKITARLTGVVFKQEIRLQSKTVKPSTSIQSVKPDLGFDGLSFVTVMGNAFQNKTVKPSHSQQLIVPDGDYTALESVTVEAVPKLQACEASAAEGVHETVENVVNIGATVSVETPQRTYLEWEVVPVDGAQYGFALNSNGYYESQNKGVKNSYALCKVIFRTDAKTFVEMRYIRYSESQDIGMISAVDTMLSLSNDTDGKTHLKNSADEQKLLIILPAGEHFICVKYRKDSYVNSNNDSLQFKIAD